MPKQKTIDLIAELEEMKDRKIEIENILRERDEKEFISNYCK